MSGKHGKYVYVRRNDGWFVKLRVFKSRGDEDPDKYVVLDFKRKDRPLTHEVLEEEDLPPEVIPKLYEV